MPTPAALESAILAALRHETPAFVGEIYVENGQRFVEFARCWWMR